MQRIFGDFEVYSEWDVTRGMSKYAKHPSTEVLCLAYFIEGFHTVPQLWTPGFDNGIPADLRDALDAGFVFHAHNAAFEKIIWREQMVKRFGWQAIPDSQWRCTAARCAYANLPRGLDKLSKLLNLGDKGKDKLGRKALLKLCKPQRGKRSYDPALYQELYDYCIRDVIAEMEADRLTSEPPESETEIWKLDQIINERGVPIDLALCNGAKRLIAKGEKEDNRRLLEITAGYVDAVTKSKRIIEFMLSRGIHLPKVFKRTKKCPEGMMVYSLDKTVMADFVMPDDADPVAVEVLDIRMAGAKASVKKMHAAVDWTDLDGRCRHTLKYFTAGPGRWSGAGPQFQNMLRAKAPSDEALQAITGGDWEDALTFAPNGNVIALIAQASRSMICAEDGHTLVTSDFAGIEARVLAWICGNAEFLKMFFNGEDLYKAMASRIYGVPVDQITKEQRQVGKAAILGLGYGMGAKKFVISAKNVGGVTITEEFAQGVVEVFRGSNPMVTDFWRDLETSFKVCVQTGKTISLGRLTFFKQGDWVRLRLPSGRCINYYKPRLVRGMYGKYDLEYISPVTCTWKKLYGGLLAENVVQAISRDLMASAMLRAHDKGVNLILTVHDELVAEVPLDRSEYWAKVVHEAMETLPAWAKGCPVTAETHISKRFTK